MYSNSLAQKEVRIERITVDQGLSQSAISAITQDRYGYLWIATLDGLNRYDGREFKIYKHDNDDAKSLHRDHVNNLYVDSRQTLWVCYEGMISRYNPSDDNFDHFSIQASEDFATATVHDMDDLSDSVVLLSTTHGMLQFNIRTGSVTTSAEYRMFDNQNITNVFIESNGDSWVITHYKAYLKRKNDSTWSTVFADPIGLRVYYHQPSEKIYLQTKNGLYMLDRAEMRFSMINEFKSHEDFDPNNFGMMKLSNGELWLFRKSIYVYDKEDKLIAKLNNIPQNPTSLSGDYLSCIFESNDHVVWIGTNGFGLNKYDPVLSVFKYVGSFESTPLTLSNNFVYSIFTDDDNVIYVGTFSGLDVLNLQQNKSDHYALTGQDGNRARPQKIFRDKSGVIWLCTDKGLLQFDGKKIKRSGVMMLDTININDVVMTSAGRYFLAGDQGIYTFEPAAHAATRFVAAGSSPLGFMDNALWIESALDIKCIDPSSGNIVRTIEKKESGNQSFRSFPIKCFYQDRQGHEWIGSWGGGLTLVEDGNSFEYFNEKNGLPNTVVYGILEDDHNNLWLSTNRGISVFDKGQKKSIRNFYKEDGLQGNEFNTKAFHKSPHGRFYFGGTNGLTFFDPDEAMSIRVAVPKTVLAGFFVNNVRVERLNGGSVYEPENIHEITLQANERNFAFEIAALGFSSPSRIQYKYILENFNPHWSNAGHQHAISFTNIPPGKYSFRAKSANSFGEWEKDGLAINIVVKGPFYSTTWFKIAVFLFIVISIYGYNRRRTAVFRARASHLEALVNERTRKIQSMNEEIAAQNEELAAQSEALIVHNDELTAIKFSLEEMVSARTADLQKLNRELILQNSKLEQFAFITAHNVRGPVARIKGLLQLLPKAKMEELTLLESCVFDLDEVIADLSRILDVQRGTDKLFETVQLKAALMQAISKIGDELEKNGATLQMEAFEDISVVGIPSYFINIFYSLIQNSIKFADATRSTIIKVRAKRNGHTAIIEVEDNGLGIDMRYAEGKIFSLYQRFHPAIKGKGFGLFLIKTQVEAMNGSVEVISCVNQGSIFRITIPTD